jgi:hypothetical protein
MKYKVIYKINMHNHKCKNKKFLCRSILPRKVHQAPLLPLDPMVYSPKNSKKFKYMW